eukprot:scaffold1390_cov138-Cylindrotheca_fusiformis.AAC.14
MSILFRWCLASLTGFGVNCFSSQRFYRTISTTKYLEDASTRSIAFRTKDRRSSIFKAKSSDDIEQDASLAGKDISAADTNPIEPSDLLVNPSPYLDKMDVSKVIGPPTTFAVRNSVGELAPFYDAFILDQYGVLHNGEVGLEGAVECVAELAKQGKKMIILSNTSGPAASAIAKLPKYGFDTDHFAGAVTSGEECSRYIRESFGSGRDFKRVVWFTWDGTPGNPSAPTEFLRKCGNVQPANSVDEADFVLAHGSHVWQRESDQVSLGSFLTDCDMDVIDPILKDCLNRKLPMVCANPDFVVRMADSSLAHMPGNIAERYREFGGECKSFGKPNPEHFEACLRELGVDASKAVHVGDSLHHDIAGANAANLDSILITSGIHCKELQTDFGILPDEAILNKFIDQEKQVPTYVMPAFRF